MRAKPKTSAFLLSLFQLGNLIHHFNKKSEKKWGLSLVQWATLSHLIENPGSSPQKLASTVGVHPSSLTQTLKRLEKKGFLFMTEDPRDSRKKIISITRAGKEKLEQADEKIQEDSFPIELPSQSLEKIRQALESKVRTK